MVYLFVGTCNEIVSIASLNMDCTWLFSLFNHFSSFLFSFNCSSGSFLPLVLFTFMFSHFSDSSGCLTNGFFTLLSDHFSLTHLGFMLESGLFFFPESFHLFLSLVRFSCNSFFFLMLDTEAFHAFFLLSVLSLTLLLLSF